MRTTLLGKGFRPFGTRVVLDQRSGTSVPGFPIPCLRHWYSAIQAAPSRSVPIRTSVIIAPDPIFDDTVYSQIT